MKAPITGWNAAKEYETRQLVKYLENKVTSDGLADLVSRFENVCAALERDEATHAIGNLVVLIDAAASRGGDVDWCPNGHRTTAANTYVYPDGVKKQCRPCKDGRRKTA